MLGSVQSITRPSSNDISDALGLLTSVNGDKKLKKLLEKIQIAQKTNEQIMGEARILKKEAEASSLKANNEISKAEQLQAQVKIAQENLKTEIKLANKLLDNRAKELDEQEAAVIADINSYRETNKKETIDLTKTRNELISRETTLKNRESVFTVRQKALEESIKEFTRLGNLINNVFQI